MTLIKRFLRDDSGLETVEYAVMGALITLAVVAAVTALAGAVNTRFGQLTSHISTGT